MNNSTLLVVSLALFAFGQTELSLFAAPAKLGKKVEAKTDKTTKKTAATVTQKNKQKTASKVEKKQNNQDVVSKIPVPANTETSTPEQPTLYLIDEVVAVVVGESSEVITATDISLKRNLAGQLLPEEQHIENAMIRLDAEKLKIDPTSGEKYLEALSKKNNFSFEDKQRMARDLGRTYRELIFLLQHEYMFESWLHFNFKANVVATDEQIEQYVKEHPEYDAGWIEISLATLPYDAQNKTKKEQEVQNLVRGTKEIGVTWATPIRVMENEVAEDKQFLLALQVGQVAYQDGADEFELYKLVAKQPARLKTVDERRAAIIVLLQHEAYMAKCKDYIKAMKNNFVVLRVGS